MKTGSIISLSTGILILLAGLIILGMWGCPTYNVYSAKKAGEAVLAHAQSSREVAVAEARAKMESATLETAYGYRREPGLLQIWDCLALRQNRI